VKPPPAGSYYSLVTRRLRQMLGRPIDDTGPERCAYSTMRGKKSAPPSPPPTSFRRSCPLRLFAHRMTDEDIEELFELARTDGVMPIVRRTASSTPEADPRSPETPPLRSCSPPPSFLEKRVRPFYVLRRKVCGVVSLTKT